MSKHPKPDDQKTKTADDGLTQSERFIKAAQELGTNDDPERFAQTIKNIAKPKSRSSS